MEGRSLYTDTERPPVCASGKRGTEDSFKMFPFVEEAKGYICIYVYMCRCMFMCICRYVTFAWGYREIL